MTEHYLLTTAAEKLTQGAFAVNLTDEDRHQRLFAATQSAGFFTQLRSPMTTGEHAVDGLSRVVH